MAMTDVVLDALQRLGRDATLLEIRASVAEKRPFVVQKQVHSALGTLVDYGKVSKLWGSRCALYRFEGLDARYTQAEIKRLRAERVQAGKRARTACVMAPPRKLPTDGLWPAPEGATLGPPIVRFPASLYIGLAA